MIHGDIILEICHFFRGKNVLLVGPITPEYPNPGLSESGSAFRNMIKFGTSKQYVTS